MSIRYISVPTEVDAIQYDGTYQSFQEIDRQWNDIILIRSNKNGVLYIDTLEGLMKVSIGDFVVRGIHGEYYPCKPEIFLTRNRRKLDNE